MICTYHWQVHYLHVATGGGGASTDFSAALFLTLHVLDPPTFTFVIACNNETENREF